MIDFPTDLSRNYRFSYKIQLQFGIWSHNYMLIGANGGLDLHFSGPYIDGRLSGGLESHRRRPTVYDCDKPPSHDVCWLIKCPCWHEGTTLYAEEVYLPLFKKKEHEKIFRKLTRDAVRYLDDEAKDEKK
jgi:hypothetical protein